MAAPAHFARTIAETRARIPHVPHRGADPGLQGRRGARCAPCSTRGPDVLNHNIETVPRLYRIAASGRPLRSRAAAARSLAHLRAGDSDQVRPDGRPRRGVGRGRRDAARSARGRLPDRHDRPVPAAVARQPADVALLHTGRIRRAEAHRRSSSGFGHVESGPLVRSSYHAHEQTQAYESAASLNGRRRLAHLTSFRPRFDQSTQSSTATRARVCAPTASASPREKKAAHRTETYWGRPVPGFGDPQARVLVIGLAPAAHGANRTGRVFTGDGPVGSGDFLMRAMHAPASPASRRRSDPDDGLMLSDAFIAAAVRCAPPDNKPTPDEIAACHRAPRGGGAALPRVRVLVVSGAHRVRRCLAAARRPRRRRPAAAAVRPRRRL